MTVKLSDFLNTVFTLTTWEVIVRTNLHRTDAPFCTQTTALFKLSHIFGPALVFRYELGSYSTKLSLNLRNLFAVLERVVRRVGVPANFFQLFVCESCHIYMFNCYCRHGGSVSLRKLWRKSTDNNTVDEVRILLLSLYMRVCKHGI